MKQAQKMQQDFLKMQEELESKEFEFTAGGGAVKATMVGTRKLQSVVIDPEVLDPDDVEMLQDMIVAAVNGAMQLKSRKTISRLFYESIVEHGHAHRDVAYYANLFCLTPKYFSAIVRNETGQSASHWIRYYVIAQAKLLMIRNPHASLQQISDEMGFSEQSNFSRFFKRETGITPDKWRQQQL